MAAGRCNDARGKGVSLLDPYELDIMRRHDVIPAEPMRAIAERVGFGLPRWQQVGYLACVALFGACVIFLVFWKLIRGTGIDALEWVLWPFNLFVFGIGALQFWRSGHRARDKKTCAVMLEFRRCPHCGYDLRALRPDPVDGNTVCPECGCAWRLVDGGSP
jgi:hypothetical protein